MPLRGKKKNIAGKGENAGYQHFLLFQQCFQKLSLDLETKWLPAFSPFPTMFSKGVGGFGDNLPFGHEPFFLKQTQFSPSSACED